MGETQLAAPFPRGACPWAGPDAECQGRIKFRREGVGEHMRPSISTREPDCPQPQWMVSHSRVPPTSGSGAGKMTRSGATLCPSGGCLWSHHKVGRLGTHLVSSHREPPTGCPSRQGPLTESPQQRPSPQGHFAPLFEQLRLQRGRGTVKGLTAHAVGRHTSSRAFPTLFSSPQGTLVKVILDIVPHSRGPLQGKRPTCTVWLPRRGRESTSSFCP